MSSRARVEQQPATGGNAMLVFVGLGMAFLLFMAFLNVVKAGNLFNESNLLYVALVLYAGAGALYMGFGVTGIEKYVRAASLCTAAGFVANTLAAGHRWYVAGRPPFANLYEMLLSFVWTVALLTLVSEHRFKVRIIGSVTMPLAVVSVILMQLMPSEVRPLVPALQSTWLHIHVSLAMLSYAACALSFAVAMMFLIKDNMKTETFLAGTSAMLTVIYVSMMVRFERWGGFSVIAYDLKNKQDMWLNNDSRLFLTIPDLGWIFVITLVVVATPLVLYVLARIQKSDSVLEYANQAIFVGILLQAVTLAAFIYKVKTGTYGSLDAEGLFPTSMAASPFILSGIVGGIMISLLYLLLLWRRPDLERMLPSADTLDRVTYKAIAIGFPLLTLMIAAGAYWANRAWGSYWSWDPKETWAAITWLVYAIYLHMRITRGMRGRWAAYFAIGGFAVVCFTFLGVTYLLPGLHAYA